MDKKLCINCKYFQYNDDYTPERCSHPNNLDYVSNSPIKHPSVLRMDVVFNLSCGKEGRWFEEKIKAPEIKKSWFRRMLEEI